MARATPQSKKPRPPRQRVGLKKSPRACIPTVHHNPERHPLEGSEERRALLKRRAMELKTWGYPVPKICTMIKEEFELIEEPNYRTVHDWINASYKEVWMEQKELAANHATTIHARCELMISRLLPIAMGKVHIARYRMMGGERVEVIDENAHREQIAAAKEIRGYLETEAKVLGLMSDGTGGADSKSVKGISTLVLQLVQNNFVAAGSNVPAERREKVLELTTGDAALDEM